MSISPMTRPAGVPLAAAGGLPPRRGESAPPELSNLSESLARALRPQAAYRWLLPSLAAITPQYVEMTLRGALAGNHVQAWELFDLMIDTDPEIASCITELVEGVLKRKLIIEPYHEEDEQPDEEAIERQKVVSAALRRMRPDPAADENDLKGTIRDILFAKYHGQVALEVDWSAGFGSDELNLIRTADGVITAPRATFWVHPVCYAWNMEGRLGLRTELGALRTQTRDAKNRTGSASPWNSTSYQSRPSDVDEFPEHKFLIAVGKAKAGTALGGSQLRVLAWWWVATNFCGDWLLNLAQLFGIPFRKAKYQSGTPEDIKQEIRDMLQNCGSAGYILTPEGADVEFMEAGQGAGQSPQAFLFDFADKQKRKVLLGQTMTGGGIGGAPSGSKAGMSVESDVKQCRIDAAAEFACSVLNQQLVRSIILLNYGDDKMLPSVRMLEEQEGGLNDAQRDQTLVNLGLPVGVNFLRKKYGIPAPAEDEEIVNAKPEQPAPVPASQEELEVEDEDVDEDVDKTEEDEKPKLAAKAGYYDPRNTVADAVAEDLGHVLSRLEKILAIPDDEIFAAKLKAFVAEFPAIEQSVLADPASARALYPVISAALAKGLSTQPTQ